MLQVCSFMQTLIASLFLQEHLATYIDEQTSFTVQTKDPCAIYKSGKIDSMTGIQPDWLPQVSCLKSTAMLWIAIFWRISLVMQRFFSFFCEQLSVDKGISKKNQGESLIGFVYRASNILFIEVESFDLGFSATISGVEPPVLKSKSALRSSVLKPKTRHSHQRRIRVGSKSSPHS